VRPYHESEERPMRNVLGVIITVFAFASFFLSCKSDSTSTSATQGEGVVSGTVIDGLTGGPLTGVSISAQGVSAGLKTFTTGAQGTYSFTFSVDSSTLITMTFTKSGYRDTSVVLQLISGAVFPLTIQLNPKSVITPGLGGGSGLAQTIAFLGSTPPEVSVYGVGGLETSVLGWEVRDSLGLPIDAAHAVALTFTFVGPGGGEYISPLILTTNSAGRAFTTFNSGIKAGIVQIVATATVAGRTITTSPVRLIIAAGYAVRSHFTIAATQYNFAGLDWLNRRDAITVLVGDIYSNPVAINTGVYFHTSPYPAGETGGAGVIQPSVFTNKDGLGTVELISGNPDPLGSYAATQGDGYHYVVAQTLGKGGVSVRDSILMLWTGRAVISSVSPDTFTIGNGGSRFFTFTAADRLGHPLSTGTTITVTATVPPPSGGLERVNQVQVAFGDGGTVTLEDEMVGGAGITNFSFKLSDGTFDLNEATAATVTIKTNGANGKTVFTFSGIVF